MASQAVDHIPEAARAVSVRTCAACATSIDGRPQRRFCSGACRARFSRERRERQVADTIARLMQQAEGRS
jgi:predicted nucleic acid-binding Zn ribbon protein